MLTKYAAEVVTGVNNRAVPVTKAELFKGGANAADAVVELMARTVEAISPQTVLDCFNRTRGQKQLDKMWFELGELTLDRFADGAMKLALI